MQDKNGHTWSYPAAASDIVCVNCGARREIGNEYVYTGPTVCNAPYEGWGEDKPFQGRIESVVVYDDLNPKPFPKESKMQVFEYIVVELDENGVTKVLAGPETVVATSVDEAKIQAVAQRADFIAGKSATVYVRHFVR